MKDSNACPNLCGTAMMMDCAYNFPSAPFFQQAPLLESANTCQNYILMPYSHFPAMPGNLASYYPAAVGKVCASYFFQKIFSLSNSFFFRSTFFNVLSRLFILSTVSNSLVVRSSALLVVC
jgi:hypothetical protein